MPLALPQHLLDEQAQYEAELELMTALHAELDHWTAELKQVDETLQLVWAPENVTHPALVPGRYHIIERRPAPTPPNVIPLVGENDEFREPGAWMFDMLQRSSFWSDRSVKAREKREAEATKARERALAREKEERAQELDERIKSLINPGISMAKTGRQWTYRAPARRAR
jgi:hypothetical protein